MNKKTVAFISAFIILFSMTQPMLANNITFENWETAYTGTNESEISRERNNVSLSDKYYFEGTYALGVKYPDYVTGGDAYITLRNTLSKKLSAGKYNVKFNIRGNFSQKYSEIIVGSEVIKFNDERWEVESGIEGADGNSNWKQYSLELTVTEDTDEFFYRFGGYTNGCNLDCVSITDESGDEYIQNGSFEMVSEEIISEYEADSYAPVNLITSPFTGGVAISWKNPSTANLKTIKLYDITDGEELLSNNFDCTPEANNVYKRTGLSNGKEYQYKLVISYTDGNVLEYYVYGMPQANDTQLSPWGVVMNKGNDDGYTAGAITIDSTEKASGEASLKWVSNSKGGSGRYSLLSQKVSVETGTDYRFKFKAKAVNNEADVKLMNQWANLDGLSSPYLQGVKGTYDWKDFVIDIKNTSAASINFFFVMDGKCECFWIDDISLVKIENGEEVGSNLIKSGGFEEIYRPTEKGIVNRLLSEGGDEKITLSWNGATGADKLAVFQVIDGEYHSRGYVSATAIKLVICNLQNNTEYTFALACADLYGGIGEYTQVTDSTVAPDFKVYPPEVLDGQVEINKISPGASYNVKTKVRNNNIDEDVPVVQMVALYKGKILKKLVSVEEKAKKLAPGALSTVLNATIDIPEGNIDDYRLYVFIWDSKTGMKSQYEYVTVEAN